MIPTCSTCRYFVPDELIDEETQDEIPQEELTGTCHFHAPMPALYCFLPLGPALENLDEPEGPDTTAIWPAVDGEDYCGSYKMIDRKKK